MAYSYPFTAEGDVKRGVIFPPEVKNDLLDAVADTHVRLGPNGAIGTAASVDARIAAIEARLAAQGNADLRNLRVGFDTGTPASQVRIQAELLAIEGQLVEAIDNTVNFAALGLNGLDTGTVQASTRYWLWQGYNPTTLARGALASTQSLRGNLNLTHASLAGFTHWRRVGTIRTRPENTQLMRVLQQDRLAWLDFPNGENRALNAVAGTGSYATINLGAWVPSVSRLALVRAIIADGHTTGASFFIRAMGATTGGQVIASGSVAPGVGTGARNDVWVPLNSVQQLEWNGTSGVPGFSLEVVGYWDPL